MHICRKKYPSAFNTSNSSLIMNHMYVCMYVYMHCIISNITTSKKIIPASEGGASCNQENYTMVKGCLNWECT